jgi:hypothetical protein
LAKKTLLEAHTNIQEATIVLSLLPSQKKKKKKEKKYMINFVPCLDAQSNN